MAYPPPQEYSLAERNLAAIWANYRALGYRRMIYVNTASVLEDVANRLTAAMGDNPRVTAVMLNCSDSTAHRRLTGREKGTELMRHIQRSDLNGPRAQPARSPLGPPPGHRRPNHLRPCSRDHLAGELDVSSAVGLSKRPRHRVLSRS
jgi:hypothetical protein